MGYNILETKDVERNGEAIQFVKSQGSGENSKANWKIKTSDEDITSGKFARWVGPNVGLFLARAIDKILWLKFDNAPIDRNDDLFLEWLTESESLVSPGGSSRKKQSAEIAALKQLCLDRGISEEEIAAISKS